MKTRFDSVTAQMKFMVTGVSVVLGFLIGCRSGRGNNNLVVGTTILSRGVPISPGGWPEVVASPLRHSDQVWHMLEDVRPELPSFSHTKPAGGLVTAPRSQHQPRYINLQPRVPTASTHPSCYFIPIIFQRNILLLTATQTAPSNQDDELAVSVHRGFASPPSRNITNTSCRCHRCGNAAQSG